MSFSCHRQYDISPQASKASMWKVGVETGKLITKWTQFHQSN